MKARILFLLFATALMCQGQTKNLSQFTELPEAPNAADWIYLWDTSAAVSKKVSPANLFKAMPAAGTTTLGGVKRNAGASGEFVSGIDSAGNLIYGTPAGSGSGVSITGVRVPFGNGTGSLTSDAGFEYNATTNVLTVSNVASSEFRIGNSNIVLSSPTPGTFYISEKTLTADELAFDFTNDDNVRVFSGTGVSSVEFDGISVKGPFNPYDSGTWNGSNKYATEDDVRDKIESLSAGITVADGDYGDTVVSGSGSIWTLDTTSTLTTAILNATSGANAQGDILYKGLTGWLKLPAGTNGYFLKTQGAGANPIWASTALADGDYGDVVLSASGTVWNLDTTSTLSNSILDTVSGSTAQGNVLYRGATGWLKLAPGVDGQFLKTQGTGANPAWAYAGNLIPGTFSGTGTYLPSRVYSGTMGADAAITISPALAAGERLDFNLDVTGSTRTFTHPSAKRVGYSGSAVTSFTLPVGQQRVSFFSDGTNLTVLDTSAGSEPTLGTDTAGNYVATIADSGASEVTVTGSGTESAAVTLALASGITRDSEWDTSAEIAGKVTDETGTGALVFGTAPTITLGNGTGLPISTGVSGLGTGVATALATMSSANLRSAVTDEVGAGSLMFTRSGLIRSIYVNAGAMIPRTTNGAAATTTETTTNKVMYDCLAFDQTTEEYAGFWLTLPRSYNSSTVTVRFHWMYTTGSGTVKWDIAARSYAQDDQIDQAMGTEQTAGADTGEATGTVHLSGTTPALTFGGTAGNNIPVYFQISRDVAGDTLSADALLLGCTIEFTESTTEPTAQ